MDSFFKTLTSQYESELPFVAYSAPGNAMVKAVLQSNNVLHTTKTYTESGFVFAPFNNTSDAILIPFEKEISAIQTAVIDVKSKTPMLESSTAGAAHMLLVEHAIKEIKTTDVSKIVLSRAVTYPLKDDNPVQLFKKALSLYPNAYVYLWVHPKVGCWIGATPEVLLSARNSKFTTMSLAGTQLYSEGLTWSEKEKEEQQIVTNYIVEKLKTKDVPFLVSKPETAKAGTLAHIKTTISGELTVNSSLQKVLGLLHPTPAVCGVPEKKAKQFILENENYNRLFYTGFLGELNTTHTRKNNRRNTENKAYRFNSKTTDLYVNLRCMQLSKKSATVYVGGGITASSIPEKEYIETCNKLKTMTAILF